MKNVFVITLGTRELQLNLNKIGNKASDGVFKSPVGNINYSINTNYKKFGLIKPREDGKRIYKYFEKLYPFLRFPLIEDALRSYLIKGLDSYKIILVYTDQEKEYLNGTVKQHHFENDSIYFYKIIKKLILKKYKWISGDDIIPYPINERLSDIDEQYKAFEQKAKKILSIPNSELGNIYLLPQGGIDQVNFALTLRLIEHFQDKVIQLQKPENAAVVELKFPGLFLENIKRHQMLKLLDYHEYNSISEISVNSKVRFYCNVANILLTLNRDLAAKDITLKEIDDKKLRSFISSYTNKDQMKTIQSRIDLFYASILMEFKRERIEDVIWRLGTIHELIMQKLLFEKLRIISFSEPKFTKALEANPHIITFLINKGYQKNSYGFGTNKWLLKDLVSEYCNLNSTEMDLINLLSQLSEQRNSFIHNALGASEIDVDIKLSLAVPNQTLERLITDLGSSNFIVMKNLFVGIDKEIRNGLLS